MCIPAHTQKTIAMLMQKEGAAVATQEGGTQPHLLPEEEEEGERDLDGVPLLESEPIDFSRTGGGVLVPVVGGGEGADLDGEPMEVCVCAYCIAGYFTDLYFCE